MNQSCTLNFLVNQMNRSEKIKNARVVLSGVLMLMCVPFALEYKFPSEYVWIGSSGLGVNPGLILFIICAFWLGIETN